MDAVLLDVLQARAAGQISAEAAASVMKFASGLGIEKEAALPPAVMSALRHLRPSPANLNILRQGAFNSAGIGLAGLATLGLHEGARALQSRYQRTAALKKILDTFPGLKKYPDSEIQLAYNSMHKLNPEIAHDTLAGGSLLAQILRQRDALDPSTLQMDTDLAGNLLRLRGDSRSALKDLLRDAATSGMGAAIQEGAQTRALGARQDFERIEGRRRRAFERAEAEARRGFEKDEKGIDRIQRGSEHDEKLRQEREMAEAALEAKKKEMQTGRKFEYGLKKREGVWRREDADKEQKIRLGMEAARLWEDRNKQKAQQQAAQELAVLQARLHNVGTPEPIQSVHAAPWVDSQGRPVAFITDPATGLPHAEAVVQYTRPPQISDVLAANPKYRKLG